MITKLYCEIYYGVSFHQRMQQPFTESVALQDPLTDSDGDDSRPDDADRQQYMFIWSPTYEVHILGVCRCVYMYCMACIPFLSL